MWDFLAWVGGTVIVFFALIGLAYSLGINPSIPVPTIVWVGGGTTTSDASHYRTILPAQR